MMTWVLWEEDGVMKRREGDMCVVRVGQVLRTSQGELKAVSSVIDISGYQCVQMVRCTRK